MAVVQGAAGWAGGLWGGPFFSQTRAALRAFKSKRFEFKSRLPASLASFLMT